MQGLEFVVSYDPIQAAAQPDGRFAHDPSNIWVIRKQTRRKRAGQEDEVVVLSTYFIVGDCIYMAPSVASVVGNRIVRRSFQLIASSLAVVLNANFEISSHSCPQSRLLPVC